MGIAKTRGPFPPVTINLSPTSSLTSIPILPCVFQFRAVGFSQQIRAICLQCAIAYLMSARNYVRRGANKHSAPLLPPLEFDIYLSGFQITTISFFLSFICVSLPCYGMSFRPSHTTKLQMPARARQTQTPPTRLLVHMRSPRVTGIQKSPRESKFSTNSPKLNKMIWCSNQFLIHTSEINIDVISLEPSARVKNYQTIETKRCTLSLENEYCGGSEMFERRTLNPFHETHGTFNSGGRACWLWDSINVSSLKTRCRYVPARDSFDRIILFRYDGDFTDNDRFTHKFSVLLNCGQNSETTEP
ncbi:uncharacterized protein BDR25DRAFT_363495 [Lindgomyces ingoldianus]|uniref:Uncharacterized protein n=1 Tax=Lindgomyces ingoldianus TaxID=673940 RepID=A0ACB6Q902_9PLEO|nr:uncharacterized protein BDR25DRAFT_363495 [Lindgomyces ingoldianus]KAF2462837.1 hypothetical protein BDR25DRAFT_363495 [Lindgomyces ingoldianus]